MRQSERAGVVDRAAALLFLAPLRCRKCRLRYYRPWFIANRALPVFDKPDPVRPAVAAQAPAGPPMILLLDDDPAMRKLVARLLSREGYEIREASDDAGAMGELTAEKVDLVLINLSAADAGEKAVHTLRTAHAELPIVVLSEGLRESSENLFVLPKLSRPVAVVSFIAQTLEEMADRAGVYR